LRLASNNQHNIKLFSYALERLGIYWYTRSATFESSFESSLKYLEMKTRLSILEMNKQIQKCNFPLIRHLLSHHKNKSVPIEKDNEVLFKSHVGCCKRTQHASLQSSIHLNGLSICFIPSTGQTNITEVPRQTVSPSFLVFSVSTSGFSGSLKNSSVSSSTMFTKGSYPLRTPTTSRPP